jgi:hypothetical protein
MLLHTVGRHEHYYAGYVVVVDDDCYYCRTVQRDDEQQSHREQMMCRNKSISPSFIRDKVMLVDEFETGGVALDNDEQRRDVL